LIYSCLDHPLDSGSSRRANAYGVNVGGSVTADMKVVKARKDAISEGASRDLEHWLRHLKNVTVFVGTARFEDTATARVNTDTLRANRILINVGGRPYVPPLPRIETTPFLTNSTMMDLGTLPRHLVIVGSYVGLEFAQMFRRFGRGYRHRERLEIDFARGRCIC
jgi:pyruvate/2-oxoglutarate dehydrogenase complex dihydrolipoamide dehydrogenase (E3) component